MRPADYPPPFDARDYIAAPTDPEGERIEVGILIVGAGPAGLACAVRLGQLLENAPELRERLGEVPVAVLEKGKQPGSHLLSGAVVDPRALRRLFKGRKRIDEMPFYGPVEHEAVYYLTPKRALRIPAPPTMKNHGNYVASLSKLGRWLAEEAEAAGAIILPETPAEKLLVDGARVRGVRTGDRGRGRDGSELPNREGISTTAAARMIGVASRKEKRAAASWERPVASPATICAPNSSHLLATKMYEMSHAAEVTNPSIRKRLMLCWNHDRVPISATAPPVAIEKTANAMPASRMLPPTFSAKAA